MRPPLKVFLESCREQFLDDCSGEVANDIPELNKADPKHFCISLATIDGHVYGVGDTTFESTIQSISKAFVFGPALETLGFEHVGKIINVEPSGDAGLLQGLSKLIDTPVSIELTTSRANGADHDIFDVSWGATEK